MQCSKQSNPSSYRWSVRGGVCYSLLRSLTPSPPTLSQPAQHSLFLSNTVFGSSFAFVDVSFLTSQGFVRSLSLNLNFFVAFPRKPNSIIFADLCLTRRVLLLLLVGWLFKTRVDDFVIIFVYLDSLYGSYLGPAHCTYVKEVYVCTTRSLTQPNPCAMGQKLNFTTNIKKPFASQSQHQL